MIWNNGDGTDDNNGGDGVDETLITAGTANDDDDRQAAPARLTRFDRNNAPFGDQHEATSRSSTITSFSGNDTLATEPGRDDRR